MRGRDLKITDATKAPEFEERVLQIRRVSKKTKGGNNISFAALSVVGNKKGKVGVGYVKARDVASAIKKSIEKAKQSLVEIRLKEGTIAHEVTAKYEASKVMIRPASPGAGIIAGTVVRTILELAGVKDVSSKVFGSSNKITNIRCTLKALQKLKG